MSKGHATSEASTRGDCPFLTKFMRILMIALCLTRLHTEAGQMAKPPGDPFLKRGRITCRWSCHWNTASYAFQAAYPECSSKQPVGDRVTPTPPDSCIPWHLLRTARGSVSIIVSNSFSFITRHVIRFQSYREWHHFGHNAHYVVLSACIWEHDSVSI
jgi:hypothetical protein